MTKISKSEWAWSLLRIGLGYVFLWAFIDKLFGFGVATCKGLKIGCSQAWIHGGSPTSGFLGHAATGPLAHFYHHLAGHAWVDWAFMLSLAFVGVGLFLGTWIRSAAAVGIVLLALIWSSLLWPSNTPGVDEHIIYILALIGFLTTTCGRSFSLKIPGLKLP